MRFTPLALAAIAVQSVSAAPRQLRGFGCAAPEPDAEHIKISQGFAAQEAAAAAAAAAARNFRNFSNQSTTIIETYFHVVAESTSLEGGYLPVGASPHSLRYSHSF